MISATAYFATAPRTVRNPWHGLLKSWEARAVSRASGRLASTSILDLGSGDGYYAHRAIRAGASNIRCLDAHVGPSIHPQIRYFQRDLNQGLSQKDFIGRDLIYALGILEFLDEPFKFLSQLAQLLPTTSRVVLLYPPMNRAGRVYQAYHRRHGVNIHLLDPGSVGRALKPLQCIFTLRPHPYARVEAFAHG